MSKNISNLSGRIGLKNNLFQKISDRSLKSTSDEGIKEIEEVKENFDKFGNFLPKELELQREELHKKLSQI